MAADRTKAIVLAWQRKGRGWIVYSVPAPAFTSAHIRAQGVAPGFTIGASAADVLTSLSTLLALDIRPDGSIAHNSAFNRHVVAVYWSPIDATWVAAMGDASIDARIIIAEKPDFASALAAAVAAAS